MHALAAAEIRKRFNGIVALHCRYPSIDAMSSVPRAASFMAGAPCSSAMNLLKLEWLLDLPLKMRRRENEAKAPSFGPAGQRDG